MRLWRYVVWLFWFCALTQTAMAHVGTSAVFVQGNAGPYAVYVTVTPPAVVPGEASVSIICAAPGVRSASAQANVLGGSASQYMPEGIALTPGPVGSHEFHGSVWIMTQGSWQVRVTVAGDAGEGALSVPLAASPVRLMAMSRPFGALLIVLGGLLVAGLAAIVAALFREAQREPGQEPDAAHIRLGYKAAAVAVLGCAALVLAGNHLWRKEITRYSGNIYQPLAMQADLDGTTLHLHLKPPSTVQEAFSTHRLDDLVLDHNHLMHLYLVRWPEMDVVLHLHPTQRAPGEFDLALPAVETGDYRLFADVVHADGFPETATATMHLPTAAGQALAGDDAVGTLTGLALPDGLHFAFAAETPQGTATALRVNEPVLLRFILTDASGHAPPDMTTYMGMSGHLAVIKDDASVFAHLHPNGSAAMAAYMLANEAGMKMGDASSNAAAFPFGFPLAGRYRLIVQMKHRETVETGDVDVVVQ